MTQQRGRTVQPTAVTHERIANILATAGWNVVELHQEEGVLCRVAHGIVVCVLFGQGKYLKVVTQRLEIPIERVDFSELYAWFAQYNSESTFGVGAVSINYKEHVLIPSFTYIFSVNSGATDQQLAAWLKACLADQMRGFQSFLRSFDFGVD